MTVNISTFNAFTRKSKDRWLNSSIAEFIFKLVHENCPDECLSQIKIQNHTHENMKITRNLDFEISSWWKMANN